MTINDAYPEDSGDYTCEVWNEIGSQTSSFKITVKGIIIVYFQKIDYRLNNNNHYNLEEKKGKAKRVRPASKPGEADKKDEDEIRKEKRKSDALKKPEIKEPDNAKQSKTNG